MNTKATFPRLLSFRLDYLHVLEQDQFSQVLADARLVGRTKREVIDALPSNLNIPGVYFWLMSIGDVKYKIYEAYYREGFESELAE